MLYNKLTLTMKEPANALSHLTGALLSVAAVILMLFKAAHLENSTYRLNAIIFGASLVLLYSASTIYHWIKGDQNLRDFLRKIDHAMIYILIAGTYTPLCLSLLQGSLGRGLLIFVWILAFIGIITTIFWLDAPRWVYTGFYLGLGWMGIVFIWPLFKAFQPVGFAFFLLGGLFYTFGAIIYGKKMRILNLKGLGFHETFHLFILAGSLCHFIMVYYFIML